MIGNYRSYVCGTVYAYGSQMGRVDPLWPNLFAYDPPSTEASIHCLAQFNWCDVKVTSGGPVGAVDTQPGSYEDQQMLTKSRHDL